MSEIAQKACTQLRQAVVNAMERAMENRQLCKTDIPPFIIETPADRKNGDLATNAAMVCAKVFKMPPFKIAQAIMDNIDLTNTYAKSAETAGPGFINFFLQPHYYADILMDIEKKAASTAAPTMAKRKRSL